jgi:hypothetical protein
MVFSVGVACRCHPTGTSMSVGAHGGYQRGGQGAHRGPSSTGAEPLERVELASIMRRAHG